jgi:2-keto-3-deoxy-L-rhamnonate aldolase RhmA
MLPGFRQRLLSGQQLLGAMVTLPTPATAEILVDAGFEWLFVDGEHGPLTIPDILSILQAVGHRAACLVRVPMLNEADIKRVLDLGAQGVIVPQVNSPEMAADVVRFSRYSPAGTRGVGLARAQRYGFQFAEYLASANDEVCVIVQAEHRLAVESIEQIVRVPGVDGVMLGPYDMSASYSKMGQITDPEIVAAIQRVATACRQAKVPLGSFGVSADAVRSYVDLGATLLCCSVDTLFLGGGARKMLKDVRGGN